MVAVPRLRRTIPWEWLAATSPTSIRAPVTALSMSISSAVDRAVCQPADYRLLRPKTCQKRSSLRLAISNTGNIYQGTASAGSTARITQLANGNRSFITQDNQGPNGPAGSTATSLQSGNDNYSEIIQQAAGNDADVRQSGANNDLYVTQTGLGNTADVRQTSSDNLSTVT